MKIRKVFFAAATSLIFGELLAGFGSPKAIQQCEIDSSAYDAFEEKLVAFFGVYVGGPLTEDEELSLNRNKGRDGTYYISRMKRMDGCLSRYCYVEKKQHYYVSGYWLQLDGGKITSDDMMDRVCKMAGDISYDAQKGRDGVEISEKDGERIVVINTVADNGRYYLFKLKCEDVSAFLDEDSQKEESQAIAESEANPSVPMTTDGTFFGYKMGMKRGDRPYVDERDFGPEYGALRKFTFKFGKTSDRLYEIDFTSDPYVAIDPKVEKVLKYFSKAFIVRTDKDVQETIGGVERVIKFSYPPRDEKGRVMKTVTGRLAFLDGVRNEAKRVAQELAEAKRKAAEKERDEKRNAEKQKRIQEERDAVAANERRIEEIYQSAIREGKEERLKKEAEEKPKRTAARGEKPDSFFGIPFDTKIDVDPSKPIGLPFLGVKAIELVKKTDGFEEYRFYPVRPFRIFDRYTIRVSPISKKVESIELLFEESSKIDKKIPQGEFEKVKEIISAKYGIRAKSSDEGKDPLVSALETAALVDAGFAAAALTSDGKIKFKDGSSVFVECGIADMLGIRNDIDPTDRLIRVVFVDNPQHERGKKEREQSKINTTLETNKSDVDLL